MNGLEAVRRQRWPPHTQAPVAGHQPLSRSQGSEEVREDGRSRTGAGETQDEPKDTFVSWKSKKLQRPARLRTEAPLETELRSQ